jgi:Ser-tRNA(Ala) deacylase AlaX
MKQYADQRMHTAEHILNQTMVRMFACGRSFSSHIEKKKSKCDYRFERALSEEETRELERRVNDVIARDLPVEEEFVSRAQADSTFDTSRLPEAAGGTIRVVKIGDYDACPCAGGHVQSTKAVGEFKVATVSHENGVLRVRFKLIP